SAMLRWLVASLRSGSLQPYHERQHLHVGDDRHGRAVHVHKSRRLLGPILVRLAGREPSPHRLPRHTRKGKRATMSHPRLVGLLFAPCPAFPTSSDAWTRSDVTLNDPILPSWMLITPIVVPVYIAPFDNATVRSQLDDFYITLMQDGGPFMQFLQEYDYN